MTLKIYTKTGDRGETGLFGGRRVPKDDARVEAYGDVDELNSVVGWAVAQMPDGSMAVELRRIQADLFTLGAALATPSAEDGGRGGPRIPALPAERVQELERAIDAAEAELEPLKNFILPGGHAAAASLHLARTVCRRAERKVVSLSRDARIDGSVLVYLNRLSDLLFTLARLANHREGVADVPWTTR